MLTRLCLALCLLPVLAGADTLRVAVAASFSAPAQHIAQLFKAQTGHDVLLSSGATGVLYAQIRHGAPFDILLAADSQTPRRLITEQRADSKSLRSYALGRLALWSPHSGLIDNKGTILQRGTFRHLAIANPDTAPYGAAALHVLNSLKHSRAQEQALKSRLVIGDNIHQAYQFVASGNAELGFVALSQIMRDGKLQGGSVWIVPDTLHPPLQHQAVLLLHAGQPPSSAARQFLAFLSASGAQRVIRSYAYDIPAAAGKPL